MQKEYRIRILEKKDCKEAAKLRLSAQEWGFLPTMGLSFQIEILKATCDSKWGFGIVCIDKYSKIVGLVYATTKLSNYYKCILLRRWPILTLLALLRILRNPKLINGILEYLLYPRKVPFKNIDAEWLTMIVDVEHRNKGIANQLIYSLIDEFKIRGINEFKSTVAAKNIITCYLHEKFGFKLLGTFALCKEPINIYNFKLNSERQSAL